MKGEAELRFPSSVHRRDGENHREGGWRPRQGPEHHGLSQGLDEQVGTFRQ